MLLQCKRHNRWR